MRLNLYLARCGIAARRKASDLIISGAVRVNGKIVLLPYYEVDTDNDTVEVNGKVLHFSKLRYIVMNKPTGVVCAVSDRYDPVVLSLLSASVRSERIFPVGRLDRDSEGLIILSNDGEFAQSILHPSKGVTKEYEVLLNLAINVKQIERWKKGFRIEGRYVKPLSVEKMTGEPQDRWLRIEIGEGLKREIRTMAHLAGFAVVKLIRRRIGKMVLQNLQSGDYIDLSFSELYTKIFKGGAV